MADKELEKIRQKAFKRTQQDRKSNFYSQVGELSSSPAENWKNPRKISKSMKNKTDKKNRNLIDVPQSKIDYSAGKEDLQKLRKRKANQTEKKSNNKNNTTYNYNTRSKNNSGSKKTGSKNTGSQGTGAKAQKQNQYAKPGQNIKAKSGGSRLIEKENGDLLITNRNVNARQQGATDEQKKKTAKTTTKLARKSPNKQNLKVASKNNNKVYYNKDNPPTKEASKSMRKRQENVSKDKQSQSQGQKDTQMGKVNEKMDDRGRELKRKLSSLKNEMDVLTQEKDTTLTPDNIDTQIAQKQQEIEQTQKQMNKHKQARRALDQKKVEMMQEQSQAARDHQYAMQEDKYSKILEHALDSKKDPSENADLPSATDINEMVKNEADKMVKNNGTIDALSIDDVTSEEDRKMILAKAKRKVMDNLEESNRIKQSVLDRLNQQGSDTGKQDLQIREVLGKQ